MEYPNARRVLEALAEVEAANNEAVRVAGGENFTNDDVVFAADRYVRAIRGRNAVLDEIGVDLGERASGPVDRDPLAGAEADGTAEPGAAEKTREPGTTPEDAAAAAETEGGVQAPAGDAGSRAEGGPQGEPPQGSDSPPAEGVRGAPDGPAASEPEKAGGGEA